MKTEVEQTGTAEAVERWLKAEQARKDPTSLEILALGVAVGLAVYCVFRAWLWLVEPLASEEATKW